jgi:hypothetical protein
MNIWFGTLKYLRYLINGKQFAFFLESKRKFIVIFKYYWNYPDGMHEYLAFSFLLAYLFIIFWNVIFKKMNEYV